MTAAGDYNKKLIEVALPLDEINAACKADKDRKTGTLRNLHKWFAPMPLPAWRALIFAALVDDPGEDEKRAELLDLIKRLVANGADLPGDESIAAARAVIEAQYPDGTPTIMDPFCGGGSTLIEAQRLGLATYGSDLNPVPVLISRALTELLPKVAGRPPLHAQQESESGQSFLPPSSYPGLAGLQSDVLHYAKVVLEQSEQAVAQHYPHLEGEVPIAWLWARTAPCPNPACGVETILTTSWALSRKSGSKAWIEPHVEDGHVVLDVVSGQTEGDAPSSPKAGRGASFVCLACGGVITDEKVQEIGQNGDMGLRMTAVVAQRSDGRVYRSATEVDHAAAAAIHRPDDLPDLSLGDPNQYISPPRYGLTSHLDLFTNRQLLVLKTFADQVAKTRARVLADGGDEDWVAAVVTVLGLALGKMVQYGSSQAMITTFADSTTRFNSGFGRNDLPMTWDFFELNFFGSVGGDWNQLVKTCLASLKYAPLGVGTVARSDARNTKAPAPALIATDPPYFDAIAYADLSDVFYPWHRLALRETHPDLYGTVAAPKANELTAFPWHHGGTREAAREYFIGGFTEAFSNLQTSMAPDLPMLVVYASKEQKAGDKEETRWSSILTAMLMADLEITGTWPIHGTGATRMRGIGANAVATYVVMACRPRPSAAGVCSLADFNRALRRELRSAVRDLQAAGILPVDLAQAAMGPGMQIYSRYSAVVDQSGSRVPVEEALRLINSALGEVLDDQEGELDPSSRFAVAWWEQHGWDQGRFDLADKMVRPKGISVDDLVQADVISLTPGWVRLNGMGDLDRRWLPTTDKHPTAWEAVHHLADRLLEGGGSQEAGALMGNLGTLRDPAQALVYRLHDIAAKKAWTKDQERYNALIASWSDLLQVAATTVIEDEGNRLF